MNVNKTNEAGPEYIMAKTMEMLGLDANIGDKSKDGSISMDNLYPALIQCFAIIICG